MAAGLRVGLDDKLYFNAGNYAVPTWTEITIVQDVNLNLETDKAEARSRASNFVMTKPTHTKGPVDFKMLADTSYANYGTLRDAYVNRTVMDFAIADAAIATSGTEYWRADYYLYSFKKAQPLGDVNTVDVTMDLAISSNAPAFTTAS